MEDADPMLSKLILAHAATGAALNLISSVRTRGIRRSAVFLALSVGLPAIGEWLATGPLGLLRHRTRPRVAGVPVAILLGWYCAIHGSHAIAERALAASHSSASSRERLLPLGAALVGTSLDLALDPAGLDAGLWEWRMDGTYAKEIVGPNDRSGVPLVNYVGWLLLVACVVAAYGRANGRIRGNARPAGRLPALLLLPYYLAAASWALKTRRLRYILLSLPLPVAVLAALAGGPGR